MLTYDEWITVKPHGNRSKGQPVKLDNEGRIVGGLGGKFNGKHISQVRSGNDEKEGPKTKQHRTIAEVEGRLDKVTGAIYQRQKDFMAKQGINSNSAFAETEEIYNLKKELMERKPEIQKAAKQSILERRAKRKEEIANKSGQMSLSLGGNEGYKPTNLQKLSRSDIASIGAESSKTIAQKLDEKNTESVKERIKRRAAEIGKPSLPKDYNQPMRTQVKIGKDPLTLPTVSKETENRYNRAVYISSGRNFNEEIRSSVKHIIGSISENSGLVETEAQKNHLHNSMELYAKNDVDHINKMASMVERNPSWIVTGRANRNLSRMNKGNDREMDAVTKHTESQKKFVESVKRELTSMKTPERKQSESTTFALRKSAEYVGQIASNFTKGFKELAKHDRTWAGPKVFKHLSELQHTDPQGAKEHVAKLNKSLIETHNIKGGIVEVLSSRSKAGKLAKELLSK